MPNTTYIVMRRKGTRAGLAPGRVRLSVTLTEETFVALRARADKEHLSLSGQVSEIVTAALAHENAGVEQ